jgi:hypothetical protein
MKAASDKVWHEGLLLKLESKGISGSLLAWFRSYLSHREQRVLLGASASYYRDVSAGVPQGSVLGPILFLVFIDDLPDNLSNTLDLFADDGNLWATINSTSNRSTVAALLNRDLAAISSWAGTWLVTFNLGT